MAEEQIEISISLDDGSVRQGFARIQKAGDSTAESLAKSFAGVNKAILAAAAAYFSFRAATQILNRAVDAASAQEDAINRLNNALRLSGQFTEAASRSFQDLATELQRTTRFEDDQVISLSALAVNYSKTVKGAQDLTKAAIDLATATGVDVETALKQLGSTLSGVTGTLGKTVPVVKSLTDEQLKAGEAIRIVSERFRGAAAGDVDTFSGRVTQLANNFGDLFEEIGKFITGSPALRNAIGAVSSIFGDLASSIAGARGNKDFLRGPIEALIEFGNAVIKYIARPLEVAFQISDSLVRVLNTGFRAIIVIVSFLGDIVQSLVKQITNLGLAIIGTITRSRDLARSLVDSSEKLGEVNFSTTAKNFLALQDAATGAANAVNGFGTATPVSDAAAAALNKVKTSLDNVKASANDAVAGAVNVIPSFSELFGIAKTEFGLFQESLKKLTFEEEKKKIEDLKQSFKQLGVEGRNALGQGIGAGFAQFGQALVKGENAVEAFAKAFIGAIGQQAIASGTRFILEGLAYLVVPGFQGVGGAMIAAGSALAAFGGVLSALGPSASPTAGGAAGASGQLQQQPSLVADEDALLNQADQQRVTVNIQGDVLDSRESGLRIVELIQDAFDTQGAQVRVT